MRANSWLIRRIGGFLGFIWLLVLALSPLRSLLSLTKPDPNIFHGFQRATKELDLLKKQNDFKIALKEFPKLVKELGSDALGRFVEEKSESASMIADLQKHFEDAQNVGQQAENTVVREGTLPDIVPSLEFEQTRRIIAVGVQETMFYLEHQIKNFKTKLDANEKARINEILEEGRNHLRVVKYDLERLSISNGLKAWRERESADLSNLVQKRLYALQNPASCVHAKKLVCNIHEDCGFGCQIHHAVYCFIVAYRTQRTLILKSKGWIYNKNGWEDVFQPVSDTCTDPAGVSHSLWSASDETRVVEVLATDSLNSNTHYLPLAIPEDLSERIMRLHGNPAAWWVGQFLKYMLKPQDDTKEFLNSLKTVFGFSSPIVGIHIRRTDKIGTEAEFHSIEKYMEHVEEFYKDVALTKTVFEKKVFVASDDPTVWNEARHKFPGYTFLGDPSIAKTASVATRYSKEALKGIIGDIHLLSLTDYLVCTFSSNVCRLAYEIMQGLHPDATNRFRSLDHSYFFSGQNSHNQKARFPHHPRENGEMNLEVGDVVGIVGNKWNGYSYGTNWRTMQTALFPSYKMEEVVDIAKMTNYSYAISPKGRRLKN